PDYRVSSRAETLGVVAGLHPGRGLLGTVRGLDHGRGRHLHEGLLARVRVSVLLARLLQFLAYVAHELVDLRLHLLHLAAHVQDDLDAGEVDAEIAREVQDHLELAEVVLGVEARVAVGARRLEEPLALVEAKGLGVDAVGLGHHADHVVLAAAGRGPCLAFGGSGAAAAGHGQDPFWPAAGASGACRRGLSGLRRANSRSSSRLSSSRTRGTHTRAST